MIKDEKLKEIIVLAGEAGAKAAMQTLEKEKAKKKKEKLDQRLHNTKLLMENYRLFKEHYNNAVYEDTQTEDSEIVDFAAMMEEVGYSDHVFVNAIRKSAARTRLIVKHVDQMLEVYKTVCERRGEYDTKTWYMLYYMYISPEPMSQQDIADMFGVDRTTVYRRINGACAVLSSLLYGIDAMDS